MRMMRFQYKELVISDALSRSPLKHFCKTDENLQADCDAYVNLILNSLPATDKRLKQLQQAQEEDETCKLLFQFCKEGWPSKLHGPVKQFKSCSAELSIHNGLLLRGTRIVIPQSMRTEILQKLHSGHQGITKCRERAKQSVWWPGLVSVNRLKKQFRNV